ncbi:MAG: methionine--tRNA ligase, partial [Coriobacteriia bacterium]|nr:methionine--tRNA ligase [Coriobacteriia bacterium]
NYWCDPDARIYQFIGQDNIYFYGVAQTALWSALATSGSDAAQDCEDAPLSIISEYVDTAPPLDPPHGQIQQSQLIANYHLQFLGKKASSSGAVRPPMADELLDYYTSEQLRAHFLALGLGQRPVSFQPKPLDPAAQTTDGDPVQKEGSLLTNVLNRLARSCFYSAHNDTGGIMPLVKPDEELVKDVQATLLEYERIMYLQEFHNIMHLADGFIRRANKYWADNSKLSADDPALRRTVLGNSFYLLKAACLMMHPVAPSGARMVFEYLDLDVTEREFFSWEHAYTGFDAFIPEDEKAVGGHLVKELPPRTDFFPRHPSQFQ